MKHDPKNDENFEGRGRGDKVLIPALAVLGVALFAAVAALSVLRGPEWIQVVLVLAFFAAVWLGLYRYVAPPSGRNQENRSD